MVGHDIILCVGHARFRCHRFMLASSSKPFAAMLTGSMREAQAGSKEVTIGMDPEVFRLMLQFIYTGATRLGLATIMGLLAAADQYEVTTLRSMCIQYIESNAAVVLAPDKADQTVVGLPEELLVALLLSDNLTIREIDLFQVW